MEKLKYYEDLRTEFSELELAVFDYGKKIALAAYKVTPEEVENLKRWFSDAEMVELTELACHFTALSKFFRPLDVEIG